MQSQSTIAALLASPLRVRVYETDCPEGTTGECTLGEYAQGVFDVFGEDGPDSETLGSLVAIAGIPQGATIEVGPDTVTVIGEL